MSTYCEKKICITITIVNALSKYYKKSEVN